MATPEIEEFYEFSLIQISAESYIERVSDFDDKFFLRSALTKGTNRLGYKKDDIDADGSPVLNQGWPGFTRMTDPQFEEFYSKFQVIHQWSDNPSTGAVPGSRPAPDTTHAAGLILNSQDMLANTGFSATLIRRRGTDEYTLALRSTESRKWEDGGDSERDMRDTDQNGVVMTGFALAQLDALEKYYEWIKANQLLPQGATLNVTGYSLGGHLATVFTEIHRNDPWLGGWGSTVTFNGAGRGTWDGSIGTEADMLAYYRQVLIDPASAGVDFSTCSTGDIVRAGMWLAVAGFTMVDISVLGTIEGLGVLALQQGRAEEMAGQSFDAKSVYQDPRYGWAVVATMLKFDIQPQLPGEEHSTLADADIYQLYGYEDINNVNFTANSQNNGPEFPIGIESQPLLDRLGEKTGGDYGFGHSIVLVSDSLALQRVLNGLDPAFSSSQFNDWLPKLSFRDTQNVVFTDYEYDLLENCLDGLRRAVLGGDSKPTPIFTGAGGFGDWDSRNTFHANLLALTSSPVYEALCGKVRVCVADFTEGEVARDDFAAFLGLYTLSPLYLQALPGQEAAVADALAAAWPDLHAEWLADRDATTPAYFSDNWVHDRRDFLAGLLQVNDENADDATVRDPAGIEGRHFLDARWSREVSVLAANENEIRRQVLFDTDAPAAPLTGSRFGDHLYAGAAGSELRGEEGDDELEGRSGRDILYGGDDVDRLSGMAGDDVLIGGRGRDRLEGGLGRDEYRIRSGDGIDTIFDLDGDGQVYVDDIALTGGIHESASTWRSADGRFRYVLETAADGRPRVLVQPLSSNTGQSLTQVFIEGFRQGMLNISLPGAPLPDEDAAGRIRGDIDPDWLYVVNQDGSITRHLHWDALGNIKGTPDVTPRPDMLLGGGGDDVIEGGYDNDTLYGRDGADRLDGGVGNDLVAAGRGRDELKGGDGDDILFGDSDAWLADTRASLEVVPATVEPPVDGASFLDSGVGWVRFSADAASLPPPSRSYPDAMTAVLAQMEPARFSRVRLLLTDRAEFTPAEGGDDHILAGAGDDLVHGEGGSDVLAGEAGSDKLFGGAGNDVLDGGEDDDLLFGDALVYAAFRWSSLDLDGTYRHTSETEAYEAEYGSDILHGGAGSDYLFGMAGADSLYGEAGNDTLVGDFQEVVAIPVLRLDAEFPTVTLDTSEHFADAVLHHGDDFLDGGDGDDHLIGLAGGDDLLGGEGADVLVGDGNSLEIQGRYGDDYLAGDGGDDFLLGSGGDDRLVGGEGNDVLWGDENADPDAQPLGQWGAVTLAAGTGAAPLAQERHGRDRLAGGAGSDVLVGGGRDDELHGDDGDDLLFGDGKGVVLEGHDKLYGGSGADELQGGAGDDLLMGEQGRDRLFGQAGSDLLDGGGDDDYLDGGAASDHLEGGDGIDTLFGAEGDDHLAGGDGDDQLSGDAGADVIEGGRGRDYLAGGEGDDVYLLRAGDGEIIDGVAEMMVDSGGSDSLRFIGVDLARITVRRVEASADLVVQYGLGDGLYIAGGLEGAIDRVESGGGASMSFSDFLVDRLEDPVNQVAGAGGVAVGGSKVADQLVTVDRNIVTGGTGNDRIELHGSANTIVLRRGDGLDRVTLANTWGEASRVRFGPGIAPADIELFLTPFASEHWLNIRLRDDPGTGLVFTGLVADLPLGYSDVLGFFDFTRDDGSVYSLTYAEMLADGFDFPATEDADSLHGSAFDEHIDGLGGHDYIDGGSGNDQLVGGAGDDGLAGGAGDDVLAGGPGNDSLRGDAGHDTYLFAPGDGSDTLDVWDADDLAMLAYNAADITFRHQDNSLVMTFRDSTDEVRVNSYFFQDGQNAAARLDIVSADGVHFDYALVHALAFTGGDGDDLIVGMAGDDVISGGAGNDVLAGAQGNDRLEGGSGNDLYAIDEGNDSYVFGVGSGHDRIEPTPWAAYAWGVGSDTILLQELTPGQVMATRIDASQMALKVLATDDWIAFRPDDPGFADLQVRFADGSIWRSTDLLSLAPLTEGADRLVLMDTDDDLHMLGGNDVVDANGGRDTLWGDAGNDTLRGGGDDDALYGGTGEDLIEGGAGQDTLFGEEGADHLAGGGGDDVLEDGAGADTLDGGSGNDLLYALDADAARDTLTGGAGDDAHFIAEAIDSVVEVEGGGVDSLTFLKGGSYTVPLWIEQVHYVPGASLATIKITGNLQDNFFDVRYSPQKDTLAGGTGNDTYYYLDAVDVVTEARSGGVDTIYFRGTSYSLGSSNIENAYLCRPAGSVLVIQAWTLTGSSAANLLGIEDGFALNASGGDGNDTLVGCANGYGVFDRLDGGNGDDILDGRSGADTLVGGGGNDTFHVYGGETLVESAKGGVDTVLAHLDFSLAGAGINFENLTLDAEGPALRGIGNTLANRIVGNSSDNFLDGGDGADTLMGGIGSDILVGGLGIDTLVGGVGDDRYVVDQTSDLIQEKVDEGIDSVEASASFTLAGNVENLTLTGGGNLSGTGNTLGNQMRGNAGDNTLTGMSGNDTYFFGRSGGSDTIVDSDATAGNQDLLLLDAGIARDQLWFRHVGSNLEIALLGGSDKVTVSNWYGGASSHVERIQLADGSVLLDSQVERLVQAMAGMTPPSSGQMSLSPDQYLSLEGVLAAAWQSA